MESPAWLIPTHIASDERTLFALTPVAPRSIWIVPLGDDATEPWRLTSPGAVEMNATLSPDGSLLAYQVLESDGYEVYVRPWPDVDARRPERVSQGGGSIPVWSRNAAEPTLNFIDVTGSGSRNVTMMRATFSVDANNNFRPDTPEALFSVEAFATASLFRSPYDVALDGRFLMVTRVADEDGVASTSEIVIRRDWLEELQRLVPTSR